MTYNKYSKMFFAPDDGGGDGEPDVIAPDLVPAPGNEPAGEPAPTPEPTPEPVPVPAAPVVDAAALAREFGQVLAAQRPAEPQKTEMSPEEAKRVLKVWEPTAQWQEKFDNLETRSAAIAEMRDGVIGQAAVLAQHYANEAQKQYAPLLSEFQAFQAQQREQRFAQHAPDLAKPEMKPLVHAVATQLVQKQQFKSEQEFFDAIKNGVESVIRVSNPGYKPSVPKPSGGIPVTTPGGGGGGGGTSGPAAKTPKAVSFLPTVR